MAGLMRVVTYDYKEMGAKEYTIMPFIPPSDTHEGRKGRLAQDVDPEYIEKKIRRNKTLFRRIAMSNNLHRHLVLTFKDSEVYDNSVDKSDELLKEFFKKLRHIFPDVKYIATREKQQRGTLHYHILINMYVPIQELNLCWNGIRQVSLKGKENEKTFKGWVSIQAHDSTVKAITYVAKYMVKDAEQMATQKGFSKKMYLSSKGIKDEVQKCKDSLLFHEDDSTVLYTELTWFMTNCDTKWDLEFDVKGFKDEPIHIRSILFEKEKEKQ